MGGPKAIRVFISGVSGNKEVKKNQQRIMMILESKHIPFEILDISEPGREGDKDFMHEYAPAKEGQSKSMPPQIFVDDEYCGDYESFDLANETGELMKFLAGGLHCENGVKEPSVAKEVVLSPVEPEPVAAATPEPAVEEPPVVNGHVEEAEESGEEEEESGSEYSEDDEDQSEKAEDAPGSE